MRARFVLSMLDNLLLAPVRVRRNPPTIPVGSEHYRPTPLASDRATATKLADDVAVAKTPEGGWRDFPPPVLVGCDEPLAEGVVDLRGVWRVEKGPLKGHIERVEQAGDRVVITAGGVIHDMRADGSLERGVNDVAGGDGAAISVAARFEDGRLDLRPGGGKLIAVTRYLDGDEMIWRYGPWRNRLRRLDPPED
jgi:hypothetical protein